MTNKNRLNKKAKKVLDTDFGISYSNMERMKETLKTVIRSAKKYKVEKEIVPYLNASKDVFDQKGDARFNEFIGNLYTIIDLLILEKKFPPKFEPLIKISKALRTRGKLPLTGVYYVLHVAFKIQRDNPTVDTNKLIRVTSAAFQMVNKVNDYSDIGVKIFSELGLNYE